MPERAATRRSGWDMTTHFSNWQQVPRQVFSPLHADSRADYMAVLACFEAAVFEPALNLETLSNRLVSTVPGLAGDDATLERVLKQLVDWNLLEASRDDSVSYADPVEFQRRHQQWALTHHGQATNAAIDAAFEQLRSAAALQPAAIDTIANALSEIADWIGDAGINTDPETAGQVHLRLVEAETHHRSLIDNLRTFTRDVTRALGRPELDDEELLEAKHHIIGYLDRYVVESEVPARNVADALDLLDQIGFEVVAAVATEGANLAPGLDGIDPRPAAEAIRLENLEALRRWFQGVDGPPMFSELLPRGRDAVLAFLRVLGIRREVARRNATLTEDFRSLARAFHRAPDDTYAHHLWSAATGLTPARHHHLSADDSDMAPSRGNPASLNPPAELVVELRRRPRSTGRPAHARPVPDRSRSRAEAQARAAAELVAARTRRAELATDGTIRLSSFSTLPLETYETFIELLAGALCTNLDNDGTRQMRSADGYVLVTVGALDNHAVGHTAAITTTTGTLRTPDCTIAIEILGQPVTAGLVATGTGQ